MPLKILRFLGWTLLGIVVVVGALLGYLKFALPNVGPAPQLKIEPTPERIARGRYLAHHVTVCMDCHSTRDWNRFSGPLTAGTLGQGGEVFDQRFGFPGSFISKNITPAGVGNWTDGELYRAITTGVGRDGHALFSIMPYPNYGRMDEEDITSIIAYLRSLPPIVHDVSVSKADFPVNFIINTLPQKAAPEKRPSATDTIAYGKYLANAAGCVICHTRQEKGKMIGAPFAGGFEFNLGNGHVVRSPNITPHETGIKGWSREDFVKRFKHYDASFAPPPVDMARGEFQTVMPWTMYAGMTEEDLSAIYAYLRTLAPAENVVVRWSETPK